MTKLVASSFIIETPQDVRLKRGHNALGFLQVVITYALPITLIVVPIMINTYVKSTRSTLIAIVIFLVSIRMNYTSRHTSLNSRCVTIT